MGKGKRLRAQGPARRKAQPGRSAGERTMPEVLADWEMYKDPADRVILDEWEEGMASHPEALEAEWSPGLREMVGLDPAPETDEEDSVGEGI